MIIIWLLSAALDPKSLAGLSAYQGFGSGLQVSAFL